ncbi:MAG: ArsR family transcriptional regulator [Candidatus Hodarchaeales archaeon]
MKIIRDPNKVSILVESNRWEIWNYLKDEGPLTAEKIAEKVDKNVSTIYRHLKKLIEVGFVREDDVQKKGNQKYLVKEYSAELTDAFFLLSEEAENLIASQKETSLLETKVPLLIDDFESLGLIPDSDKDKQRAIELASNLALGLSKFLGVLMGDRDEFPKAYDHQFEVMRRILSIFLAQLDEEYNAQAEELRKILLKK